MKDITDEIKDGGWANRQTIARRQHAAFAPVIIDDVHECAQRKIVMGVTGGVGHSGLCQIHAEWVRAGFEPVWSAIELPVAGQISRFDGCLDSDDAALMFPVTGGNRLPITRFVLVRYGEVWRRQWVEPGHVGIIKRNSIRRRDHVPLDVELHQLFRGLRANSQLGCLRRNQFNIWIELKELAELTHSMLEPVVRYLGLPSDNDLFATWISASCRHVTTGPGYDTAEPSVGDDRSEQSAEWPAGEDPNARQVVDLGGKNLDVARCQNAPLTPTRNLNRKIFRHSHCQ